MTATSVTFSAKVASDWDPQKPLTTTKLNKLYDNTTNLHERLGGDYTANTKNHTHDGIDSFKTPVGSNMLRNGDFESGLISWTATTYTGGTVAASTQDADGTAAVQIISTVLANGGGDILSNEFMVCVGGAAYDWSVTNWASVANVSSKLEVVFYTGAQAQISASTLLTNTSTPTAKTRTCDAFVVPSTARYFKIRATGGIPASGSAVGTVYFDAIQILFANSQALAGTGNLVSIATGSGAAINEYEIDATPPALGMVEYFNSRINVSGTYRVVFSMGGGNFIFYGQIYKNGVAYGTYQTNASGTGYLSYSEDLSFIAGDTVQLYLDRSNYTTPIWGKNFGFMVLNSISNNLVPPSQLQIGLR